jgi:hypothetical protein
MKKILLIGALAVATIANAIEFKAPQKKSYALEEKRIETTVTPFVWKDAATILKEHDAVRAPKASSYDMADWYYAPGAFYLGIYEGLSGYSVSMIQLPLMDSTVFYNMYGSTNWSFNGTTVASGTDQLTESFGIDGLYYVPATSDHEFNPYQEWGTGYKDTTFHIKGTMYGNGARAQYMRSAGANLFFTDEDGNPVSNAHLTLCAMETDILNEPDYDGSDFWMVGGLNGDTYYNGCGVHLAKGDTTTADTLGIIVDHRGLMKIEEILWPIYNQGRADAVSKYIPNGAQLKVNIFPIKGNTIYVQDTLASAVMTNADFVSAGAGYEWVGTLHTKFYEEDIFGTLVQMPIWIEGDFFVQLTNFNESGCDFGIYSDYYCPTTGTTLYQHNGKFSYRGGKGGGGNYGQNLGVSFDAYWPTLINDTTINEMNAPVAGGYAYYGNDTQDQIVWLLSNVNYEDWTFETEAEWIQPVIASTDYWDNYAALAMAFQVEALPEGVESRSATIDMIADGAVQTFTITQGNAPQGIETVKENRFDNKTYDVLGREIKNLNFKGVVIRNGQKTLR